MGAVQAVAATGGESRPTNLVGLVLLSMDKRGRYSCAYPKESDLSRGERVPLGPILPFR
jgi:hypothetical protein